MSRGRPPAKDMYWFAHGGVESEKSNPLKGVDDEEGQSANSPTFNFLERKGSPDDQLRVNNSHSATDSSGPPSLDREDRLKASDKRIAVEERRKQIAEAEQERNDAILHKHMERDAALEARRNASRTNIAFAFGSAIPKSVDIVQNGTNEQVECDMSRSFTAGAISPQEGTLWQQGFISPELHLIGCRAISSQTCTSPSSDHRPMSWLMGSGAIIGDVMSRSMTAITPTAPRGRRKNDLMPTVPYERSPVKTPCSSHRKRSVSMTRLDQLAQPRKHYLEANRASKAAAVVSPTNGLKSPGRPLSSASEHSAGSAGLMKTPTTVRLRRSSPRKPRPVSIAGTMPDSKSPSSIFKPFEVRASPTKRYTPSKKAAEAKAQPFTSKPSTPKSSEKPFSSRPSSSTKASTPKATTPKVATTPKPSTSKLVSSKPSTPRSASRESKTSTPRDSKASKVMKSVSKTADKVQPLVVVKDSVVGDAFKADKDDSQSPSPVPVDSDSSEGEKSKKIISEDEAKAALAEKRRLAREQAEKEAEVERQKLEEIRLAEEERLRQEEEEHRRMEEEQLRLLEEHRVQEEEKLRRAIEEREQREEEERSRREEDNRMKAEQERKAKEEAEKQRIELEEKLRKEEEERAERKKRLEKIMSRTRSTGKSNGTSPSGSVSGSDHLDGGHDTGSSGANSLDSSEPNSEPAERAFFDVGSENASLNSNDLMMPVSETASADNSLVVQVHEVEATAEIHDVEGFVQKALESRDEVVEGDLQKAVESQEARIYDVEDCVQQGAESQYNMSEGDVREESVIYEQEIAFDDRKVLLEAGLQESSVDHDEDSTRSCGGFDDKFEDPFVRNSDPNAFESMAVFGEQIPVVLESANPFLLNENSRDSQLMEGLAANLGDHVVGEVENTEPAAHSSLTDIKLPDPISETDDGSISSVKQIQDFKAVDPLDASDDVFNENELNRESSNTFGDVDSPNAFAAQSFEHEKSGVSEKNVFQSDFTGNMSDSIYQEKESNILPDPMQEPFGFSATDSISSPRSSTSSVIEMNTTEFANATDKQEPSNVSQHHNPNDLVDNIFNNEIEKISVSTKENVIFESQVFQSEENALDLKAGRDAAFLDMKSSAIGPGDFYHQQSNDVKFVSEQNSGPGDFYHQQSNDVELVSEQNEEGSVTIIKSGDSGACVGIISSLDHDRACNDLPPPRLNNNVNFETDSEDSSLDSNLSQVMTGAEKEEAVENFGKQSVLKNGHNNPFGAADVYGDVSQSNGGGFPASELFTNGHSTVFSKQQAVDGGADILSVDSSAKNNLFENAADANGFGKTSPDPFLVKGSGASGNPFHLQEDPLFMTQDFHN